MPNNDDLDIPDFVKNSGRSPVARTETQRDANKCLIWSDDLKSEIFPSSLLSRHLSFADLLLEHPLEKADGSEVTVAELLEMARESAFNALLKGFDGDEFADLHLGRIVELPMHAGRPEHQFQERRVIQFAEGLEAPVVSDIGGHTRPVSEIANRESIVVGATPPCKPKDDERLTPPYPSQNRITTPTHCVRPPRATAG